MGNFVWEQQSRRGRNHAVLLIDLLAEVLEKKLVSKAFVIDFNPTAYRQFDGARHFSAVELQAWADALRAKESEREGYLLETYLAYENALVEFRVFSDELSSKDWRASTLEGLALGFLDWLELCEKVNGYAYGYTILNRFYPDELSALVAGKEPDFEKRNELLKVLLNADKFSETRFEQDSLLSIAALAGAKGFEDQDVCSRISGHTKRFRHLGVYYFYKTPFTEADFEARARQLLEEGLEKKVEELEFQKKIAGESGKIMDLLGFSESERLKVKTIKQVAFTVNYYDESMCYAVCKALPLFQEISNRLGVSYPQFIELRVSEIAEGLRQGFISDSLKGEASERYRDSALVYLNGKTVVLVGSALKNYYLSEKPKEVDFSHMKELKGQSASPGKVRGIVKVLSSIMELDKVKKGDVLVASATYPAFVPAMEKAVAIVTDEGGLLCHAAIVSRELGVPCVVGTKIATKALKDGDLVEVDATKGIVRKLSG